MMCKEFKSLATFGRKMFRKICSKVSEAVCYQIQDSGAKSSSDSLTESLTCFQRGSKNTAQNKSKNQHVGILEITSAVFLFGLYQIRVRLKFWVFFYKKDTKLQVLRCLVI